MSELDCSSLCGDELDTHLIYYTIMTYLVLGCILIFHQAVKIIYSLFLFKKEYSQSKQTHQPLSSLDSELELKVFGEASENLYEA